MSPVQLINTDEKAAGATAPFRKDLCVHGFDTLRKGVVMDSWIQTIILRLLKGWEVEFLCKTTEPMPHKWLYEAGKIVHQMFLGFPSLYESGKEDTATVNRKSMQGSTTCRAPQSDVPKCVDFGAGTLAWKIHCYSFFLTTCALQSFGFYY